MSVNAVSFASTSSASPVTNSTATAAAAVAAAHDVVAVANSSLVIIDFFSSSRSPISHTLPPPRLLGGGDNDTKTISFKFVGFSNPAEPQKYKCYMNAFLSAFSLEENMPNIIRSKIETYKSYPAHAREFVSLLLNFRLLLLSPSAHIRKKCNRLRDSLEVFTRAHSAGNSLEDKFLVGEQGDPLAWWQQLSQT
ncbi:MAG: hypothetical protein AN485_23750, partial [Anabaena sp. MDT14b]